MKNNIKILTGTLILLGVTIGGAAIIYNVIGKPLSLSVIEEKIKSIITPKPPIGNLTPARDLRGKWKSSLSGKGVQLFGKFTAGPSITTASEDGDIELIIDSVENNIASGKIRYSNLCVTATTTAPKIKPVTIKECVGDSEYLPVKIRVSGSALDFGTITVANTTVSMQGSFLTDIISGTMTATFPPYGVIKGVFNLSRTE